jgi:hypothetical protein
MGCDVLLGIEDLPRAVVDASAEPDTHVPINPACAQCSKNECVAERAACESNTSCARLLERLDDCQPNDVMCRARAESDTGSVAASEPFIKLDRCRREKCVETCYGTGGLFAAIDSRCECADQKCGAQIRNCIQSELASGGRPGMCERRIACLAARPDPDGFVGCVGATPGGGDSYPLFDCGRKNPCGECPLATGKLECLANFNYGTDRRNFLDFKMSARNPVDSKPIEGARVVACASPLCEPCRELGEAAFTLADGKATIPAMPNPVGGFLGCFRVKPPAANPDSLFPMLVYSGRKVYRDEDVMGTFMLGELALALFASTVDQTPDPTRGHVIGTVHDCVWGRVAGAELKPIGDASTVLGYIDGISPKPERKSTTGDGAFAYLNVPPGPHTVRATLNGKEIAKQDIQVVAGHFTDVNLFPKAVGE